MNVIERLSQQTSFSQVLRLLGLANSVDCYSEAMGEPEMEEHWHLVIMDDDMKAGAPFACQPNSCQYDPKEPVYIVDGIIQPHGYNPFLPETFAHETLRRYQKAGYQV